jgi:Ceramidase
MRGALLGTAALALVLAIVASRLPSAEVWSGLTPADCTEYCEGSDRCGALESRDAIQQPLNSWSNFAFVFVGLLVVASKPTPGAFAFAAACLVLGIGSFGFHATVTRELQWLDVVGQVSAEAAVAALAVHVAWGVRWSRVLPVWGVGALLFAIYKWQIPTVATMVGIGLLTFIGLIVAARHGRASLRRGALGLLFIAVAYGIRALDVNKVGCDPAGLLYQGHALWHLLSAATLWATWTAFGPTHGQTGNPESPAASG